MVRVPFDAFLEVGLRLPRLPALPPARTLGADWPAASRLPDLTGLHGGAAFARAFAGWHPQGLALRFDVDSGQPPWARRDTPYRSDGVHIWIDTRDSREARKLTPYCHHALVTVDAHDGPAVAVFERAAGQRWAAAPEAPPQIATALLPSDAGYRLQVVLPAGILHGYAPREAPALGLAYRVRVPRGPTQDLAFGDAFPLWRNPSLWRSARLDGA
jgi:hypothetical protein